MKDQYSVLIQWSEEDGCFIASVPEWPYITAHGDTREEAAREIGIALEGAIKCAKDANTAPPAPVLAGATKAALLIPPAAQMKDEILHLWDDGYSTEWIADVLRNKVAESFGYRDSEISAVLISEGRL